jgi:competence protein ComEC
MLAGIAVIRRGRAHHPHRRRRGLLALAAAALALTGAGLAGGREALAGGGLLPQLAKSGEVAAIDGVVVSEPRASTHGAWTIVGVRAAGGRRIRERALLRADRLEELPAYGEPFTLHASARAFEPVGFGAYARSLSAWVELHPAGQITVTGQAPALIRGTNIVRARTRAAAGLHLDPERAALLSGLVTGDIRGLPQARVDQLKDAGLSHLIAVSGSNVALVLAGVLGLARLAGIGTRAQRWIGLAALCWFALLVRAEPSVLRASVMAALVLLAGMLGRGSDPTHTLAVAVVLLLLFDPTIAGQLGFGLSVLATAGVLVLAPLLAKRLPGPRRVRLLVAASLGAQLGVAPLLVKLEGAVPLTILPANLVAVPAAGAASVIGVAAALVAQVWPTAGGAVAASASLPLGVVLWAGEHFAEGPRIGPRDLLTPAAVRLAVAAVAAVAVLAAVAAIARGGRRTWGLWPLTAAAVAAAVAFGVLPAVRTAGAVPALTLTVLDVGQGDALLVEAPPAARMLIDGGPEPASALRSLRARGIRRLDAVALTHPHADHSGGLPAVLGALPVGALIVGPAPLDRLKEVATSAVATYRAAAAKRIPIQAVTAGRRFALGSTQIEVLSPPGDGSLGDEPNENSLVLRILGHNGSLLLTGDAEVAAQTRLLQQPERLRAEVLKVPHHGADTNARAFFAAVGARVAVISVGAGNDYGHPTRAALAALRGIDVHRTDTEGTVTVTLSDAGPVVRVGSRAAGRDPSRRPAPTDAPGLTPGRPAHHRRVASRRRPQGRSRTGAEGRASGRGWTPQAPGSQHARRGSSRSARSLR